MRIVRTIQIVLKAALFILIFILIIAAILSFTKKAVNTSACIEVTGKVLHKISKNKTSSDVYLFHRNTIIDSMKINGNKSFKFKLIKNDYYTLKIIKKGYIDRLISISTALPDGVKASPIFRFHFDTELIESSSVNKYNKDLLDFPIALVYYDEQKKKFVYNKKYTNSIKKEITRTGVFKISSSNNK